MQLLFLPASWHWKRCAHIKHSESGLCFHCLRFESPQFFTIFQKWIKVWQFDEKEGTKMLKKHLQFPVPVRAVFLSENFLFEKKTVNCFNWNFQLESCSQSYTYIRLIPERLRFFSVSFDTFLSSSFWAPEGLDRPFGNSPCVLLEQF